MKLFVISDVHSHYSAMMKALKEAGFDETKEEHMLLLNGDAFDRGGEAADTYFYLKHLVSLNKLIWIMGNHDWILLKRLEDCSFGKNRDTYNTILSIAKRLEPRDFYSEKDIVDICNNHGVSDFVRNATRYYYETGHYVFAHGTLPFKKDSYRSDWRDALPGEWYAAMTRNGLKSAVLKGIREPGKILVCGHVRASFGNVRKGVSPNQWDNEIYNKMEGDYKHHPEFFLPYISDEVIMTDGNVTNTHHVNCVILDV